QLDDPGTTLRGSVTLSGTVTTTGSTLSVSFQRSPAGRRTWGTFATVDVTPVAPAPRTNQVRTTLDTTSCADGLYDCRLVADEGTGETIFSPVVSGRRIDNTPPSAQMNDPGSPLHGIATLTATAGDGNGSGVSQVRFERASAGGDVWTLI